MDEAEAKMVIDILEQAEDGLATIAENDKLRAGIKRALAWRDLYDAGIPEPVKAILTKTLEEC